MNSKHTKILKNVSPQLVRDMEVEEVVNHMNHADVLSERDKGEIFKETTREKRCLELLDRLPRRGPRAYDSFITALREGSAPHLADVIIKAADSDKKSKQSSSKAFHREIIEKHRIELKEKLEPCPVIDYLFDMNIITEDEKEQMRSKKEKDEMSDALLSIVTTKGSNGFRKLVEGLIQKKNEKENQLPLAFILLKEENEKLNKLLAEKNRMLTERNSEIKTQEENVQRAENDNKELSKECDNLKQQLSNFETTLSLEQQVLPSKLQDLPSHGKDNFNVGPTSVFYFFGNPFSGTQATSFLPALPIPSKANSWAIRNKQSENVTLPPIQSKSKPSNLPKGKSKKKENNNTPGSYS